ncbi:MAG: DUF4920 domain-containing protein, partial [Flavobacteriaceae bacterium]|nr:DUF4920 domain-containing protein [Flavobacteriaceae bacterium]
MKRISIFVGLIGCLLISNCQENNTTTALADEQIEEQDPDYSSFGEKITPQDAISPEKMFEQFSTLKEGDTMTVKLRASVNEVCQAKGCWMKLDLPNGEEAMVKFKDYGFFVPKDISGKEVVIHGSAFVEEMSVDEQQHYAEDEGKSQEEIEAITTPKKTYSF